MKKLLACLLVGIALAACSLATPTSTPIPTVFACNNPGTTTHSNIAETSRGYAYAYGLYLPPCYTTDHLYPLLIHIPGRGGSPSDLFNAGGAALADEMILAGEIPPFILVSTENTDRDSEKNGESIVTDLLPYIQRHYPIRPDRQYHAVMGVSLGGIAAYRVVLQHPDQFASAALFGSGAIAGEETQIRIWLTAIKPENQPKMFFDSGEADPYMLERAKVMAGLLDEFGIPYLLHAGEGDHSYAYWMQNMSLYFRWVAEGW